MDSGARAAWTAARPGSDRPIDTACVAPWVSLEFDPAGWVLACCAGHMYPLGRIGDERLADLWGGPRAQVLRDALSRWDLSVACGGCRWHLEHGRMDPVAAEYDRFPLEVADPATPYMMQFALSNRCNLACEMCNPALSSRLQHEAGIVAAPSRYDDAFFDDLGQLIGGLRLAKFQGGEPFLVKEHRRVWSMMDDLPTPPRMVVTSNGTVWNDTVEWVLDRFSVDVSVSVDAATGSTYEQVRRGGDFATVMANVDRFDALSRAKGTAFHVSFCLMRRNWHELGAFLRWAERFESVAAINLVVDDGLALYDLPVAELEAVAARWADEDAALSTSLDRNAAVWSTQRAQLDAVLRERSDGRPPHTMHPDPAGSDAFDRGPATVDGASGRLDVHRDRLRSWSEGGPVAVVVCGADGLVSAVDADHPRLGIDRSMIGRPVGDLVDVIAAADGRRIWALDREDLGDHVVRTFGLSTTATRGTPGSMVRTVDVAHGGGRAMLIAEDRIYERSSPVRVRSASGAGR